MTTQQRSLHILGCLPDGYQATVTQIQEKDPCERPFVELVEQTFTTNMSACSLPALESVPQLKRSGKKREGRERNAFVTQSEHTRNRREAVHQTPAVAETPGRVLEADLKTLKNSQVVRKQEEVDEADIQLAVKRQEFRNCLEVLALRRSELETKQQQAKEKTTKFEKFVAENEVKRRGALKKCEATREQNILKRREIEDLTEQLKELRKRNQVLTEKIAKHKIYEDYLMKTLDYLPSIYHDSGYETVVMPIIRRYETLSITHQELLQRLKIMEMEFEQGQQQLQTIKQQHSIRQLMANKELYDLQSESEILKENNIKAEVNMTMEQSVSREKVEEIGRLLMAVKNLAQQCYLPAFGSLESMNVLTMIDMVKEYILDKADTERRVRKKTESSLATTSTLTLINKRTGSMKSIGSKTLLKSSSQVSLKKRDI